MTRGIWHVGWSAEEEKEGKGGAANGRDLEAAAKDRIAADAADSEGEKKGWRRRTQLEVGKYQNLTLLRVEILSDKELERSSSSSSSFPKESRVGIAPPLAPIQRTSATVVLLILALSEAVDRPTEELRKGGLLGGGHPAAFGKYAEASHETPSRMLRTTENCS